jgi:hypothetical protein
LDENIRAASASKLSLLQAGGSPLIFHELFIFLGVQEGCAF